MKWQNAFTEGKELVLSSASKKGIPNSIIAMSLGFEEGKLLIADCQMITTIKNLEENNNICIVSEYFKLKGKAKIYSKGKYFDICQKKAKDYKVKNALIISIKEVYNLDKIKRIL
jgi:predicted pyridoxine 5'-phosphate oxidase superfamily flavin-nucleotide-binding protein